jgi:hypothetical protein
MDPNWEDPDDDGDSDSYLAADDVTAETTLTYRPADLYRLATGYGVRLEPVAGLTVVPWWRVALERDGRGAMLREETGEWTPVSFQRNEERAIFVPEVATGELFWNVVTGPALVVEGSLRRASLYAVGGISRTIPFTRRYSATVTVTRYDIEEDREVPVTGTIDPSWGWYAGLGAGYSWGGDERAINRAHASETEERRPYETYSPAERAPWGLSVAPSFGAPVIFAPRSNRGTLAWPSPAFSIEYARPAGRLLEATAFSHTPVGRASRVLQQPVEDAEPTTINSDVRTAVVGVRLAAGRRRELSRRLTMSLGYHISPVFQTMGGGFHSVGEAVRMAGLGPMLSVARAPVGSSSIVFATVVLYTPMALGRTPYSAGLFDHDPDAATASFTSDGYTDRPPMVVASIGVRFRVAGTPARILAAPEGATERPGGRSAEGAPQDASPWWRPAVALGLGTAVPIADDPSQGTLYSGVLTTVPVALHFPFGGELGLEGTVPVGRRGISAAEAPYPIVDTTNQYGTFQVPMDATPRLNRITSIEAGYRLRREQRLSLRPALRYTWADLELWAIEARLQDGTFLAPGEEHFTRVDPVHFLGVSVEAAWTLRPALTLRATAGASRRVSAAETTVTPAFAPTVEVVYPDSLVTLGVAVTVEM